MGGAAGAFETLPGVLAGGVAPGGGADLDPPDPVLRAFWMSLAASRSEGEGRLQSANSLL
jgi:hypothetical protein